MLSRGSARLQRLWLDRGVGAQLLRPLSWLYGAVAGLRLWLYRAGGLRTERLPVPVIVVGNLVVGGAGKTPTVLALLTLLRARGWQPAVVSRGYGGSSAGVLEVQPGTPALVCGDEPLLMRRRSAAPVFVGHDRVAAARALLRRHPDTDVLISDDGLQHRRLGRDLDVLVFDERGVGNGLLLPAGPLREALPRALPPRAIVLYNAPQPTTPLPGWLVQRRLGGAVALADWWRGKAPRDDVLAALQGRRVVAAAGLARPERFFAMLRDAGLEIDPFALSDHHDYASLPWPAGTADVVVTEKDAVKLDPARTHGTRVWVVALDFVPPPGFDAEVLRILGHPPRSTMAHSDGNPIA